MAKKKKTNISVRTQLLVATGTVLLLAMFGLFVGWLDDTMNIHIVGSKAPTVTLQDVTLKGTSVCLEHKGDGPHTMECAIGLKTASGATYAISGGQTYTTDKPLELTGTLTSASNNETYDIAGTLSIK